MTLSSFKNVFILSPHTDDGELGAGGTIAKLNELGANIYYFAFSTAKESVPKGFNKNILKTEVIEATNILGIPKDNVCLYDYEVRKLNYFRQEILESLIYHREKIYPDLVLMPNLNDIHQDHQTISNEGLRAFKNTTILGYELIWNNLKFNTTSYVELDKEHLEKKINSLNQYKSQSQKNYFSTDFIMSLAKTRGTQFNVKYAECFEVIRWKIQ
tara:strand:+ start:11302 stop:11943 length:642 start_codon:yes stop_codon:yes gene_type:complete